MIQIILVSFSDDLNAWNNLSLRYFAVCCWPVFRFSISTNKSSSELCGLVQLQLNEEAQKSLFYIVQVTRDCKEDQNRGHLAKKRCNHDKKKKKWPHFNKGLNLSQGFSSPVNEGSLDSMVSGFSRFLLWKYNIEGF